MPRSAFKTFVTALREERILALTHGRKQWYFRKHLWQYMTEVWKRDGAGSYTGHTPPWCALLGIKDGVVSRLIKLYPRWTDGPTCWNMPTITTDVYADTAIKLAKRGYSICGLVRIGRFHVELDRDHGGVRGGSMRELADSAPGFFVLSLGLEGAKVETYDNSRRRLVEHPYRVVNENFILREVSDGNARTGDAGSGGGPVPDSGSCDVRETQRADRNGGAERRDDAGRVPAPASAGVEPPHPGEQEPGRGELRPAGRGHRDDDQQNVRRLTPGRRREQLLARILGAQRTAQIRREARRLERSRREARRREQAVVQPAPPVAQVPAVVPPEQQALNDAEQQLWGQFANFVRGDSNEQQQ